MSESVFPYTLPSGAVVIDERCTCGAKRSEHNWRVPMLGLATHGHGDCAHTECERFTWVGFIYRPSDCEHDNHATDLDGNYCLDCGLHETDSPNDRESDAI